MKLNYLFSVKFIKNTLATVTTIAFVFGGIFVPSLATAQVVPNVVMGTTQVTAVQTYAIAGGGFVDGWKWVFDVTVPTNETVLKMKFADFIGTTDSIPAGGNIEFYSDQSTNATSTSPILISASNSLSDPMYINSGIDLNSRKPGRQIQITVEVQVPSTSKGGSYSTSYGINTAPDTIAPVITLLGTTPVTIQAGSTYTDAGATALDNVDGILVPVLSGTVNTSTVGSNTLTYNVSNSAGIAATPVTRIVNVVDTTAPTITAPADITTEATGPLTTVTLGSPTVTDNATPAPTVTNNAPAAGFSVGTTVVTWTATDASNNVSTATQNVTVTDKTGPQITVPKTINVSVDDPTESAPVTYTVTATDLVDGSVTPVCTPTSGSTFNVGQTTVNCSATDHAGNTANASFIVNATDSTFPAITIVNPNTSPAQSKTITASTNEGTLTQSVTTGAACDSTLSFSPYADTTFTSESNNGDSVCYRAVDGANNTTYEMSAVIGGIDRTAPAGGSLILKTVDHSSGITVSAPTSGVYTITPALKGNDQFTSLSVVVNDTNLNTNPVPVYIDGSTTANGTMVYNGSVWNYTPGTPVVFTEGSHTLAATFSDNVGNTTTLTAQFTTDNTAPTGGPLTVKTVNYPAGITVSAPTSGVYTITPPLMGSDQFTSLSLVVNSNDLNTADVPVTVEGSTNGVMHYSGSGGIWNYVPGTPVDFTNGPHNLVATFSDNAGNTTTLTAQFTVDNTAPTATVAYDKTEPTNTNVVATITPSESVTVTNNGGSLSYTFTDNGSFTFDFKDLAGNTGSAVATVGNIDKVAPVITIDNYITTPTNQSITVTAHTDKGTLNSSGTDTYSNVFTANGSFDFVATDLAGNVTTQTVTITNIDTTAPTLSVAGFTADSINMTGDMTGGYTLYTNNGSTSHTLQFETGSAANENLTASTSGLYLIPTGPAQTAALQAYYLTKPPEYQTYLDSAAAGTAPFAYIKTTGDTSVKLLDGAQKFLAGTESDMIVPDDFPLGTYTVSGQIQDLAGNYTTVTFILKVVGNITVTAVTNSKSYDGTTAALATPTINSGALHGSDTANFIETYDTKDVGTGKILKPSGIVKDGNSGSNYNYTFVNDTTGVITQATTPLVITAKNLTKTYGGTITFAGTEFTESGLATGDSITSVTLTSDGSISTAPVSGSPYTITASNAVGSGLDNYTIQYNTGTLTVNPVALTATITVNDKQYDGTNSATINTQSLNGVIGSDVVSLTGGTAIFDNKNVGNGKTVTISGLSLTGKDIGNYTLTQPTGLTASITPTSLVASVTAPNKPYDGTTASVTTCSLAGIISPDVVTCSATSANFSDVNVGNGKLVTATGVTLSGANAGNYSVNPTATTNANITARLLTVTATASNKVYDGNTSVGPVTLTTDALPADGITATGVNNGYFFKDRNVGTGKSVQVVGITVSGSLSNYTLSGTNGSITANTTADITARPLTIMGLSASNKMYDGTTAATINGTPSLVGVQNDPDTNALDVVSLTGTPTGTFADDSVGTDKIVTVSGLSLTGADAGNYTLTATSTTADITPAPNPTTVDATNITSTDATLNGTNGPANATDHSFWVSTATFSTASPTVPSGVYSTPDLGAITAGTSFSVQLSSVSGLLPITAGTPYYFVAWSNVGGTWYPGTIQTFTTSTPAPVTPAWNSSVDLNNSVTATGSGTALMASLTIPTGGTSIQFNNTSSNPFNVSLTNPSKIPFMLTSIGVVNLNTYYTTLIPSEGGSISSGWGQYLINTLPAAGANQTAMFYITYNGSNYQIADGTQDFAGNPSSPMLIPANFPAGTYTLTGKVNGTPLTVTLTITN